MKTAVITVLHPKAARFWSEFQACLVAQTDRSFHLLAGYDAVPVPQAPELELQAVNVTGMSVVENRLQMIRKAQDEGYELVILLDADDTCGVRRVEITKRLLLGKNRTLLVNDLKSCGADGSVAASGWIQRRMPGLMQNEELRLMNYAGLSCMAFCPVDFPELTRVPEGLIALDWYLALYLMECGWKLEFTGEFHTFYRQHEENKIGMSIRQPAALVVAERHRIYSRLGEEFPLYGLLQKKNLESLTHPIREENPLWWENPPVFTAPEEYSKIRTEGAR